MPTFLYRCPTIGLRVEGWVVDDPTKRDEDSYVSMTCLACRGVHLINPKTGKVVGEDEEK
jgi:hypothetical protein